MKLHHILTGVAARCAEDLNVAGQLRSIDEDTAAQDFAAHRGRDRLSIGRCESLGCDLKSPIAR